MIDGPPIIGATPPALRTPTGSTSIVIRNTRARLKAAERLTFQRAALPYLRVIFPGILETQEMGTFDATGIDHLSVTHDGNLDLVVQCKGFEVTGAEVGAKQAKQCLTSVRKFREAGRQARGYLLVHNRDHRNTAFTAPTEAALDDLRRDGLVEWAAMWSPNELVAHVDEELVHRVTEQLRAASAQAMAEASTMLNTNVVEDVPFADTEFMMRRGGAVTPMGPPVAGSGDPVVRLSTSNERITILIGSFGFGKTTVAVRAASAWGKGVLFLPGARIGIEGGDNLRVLLLNGIAEATLSTLPPDDQPTLAGLAAGAARRVLRSPGQDFALVLDALDESPAIGRRDGLRSILHALKDLRVPVLVTMRSELWNTRMAELAIALSDSPRDSGGRRVHVIELGAWTTNEILAFIDAVQYGEEPEAHENLTEFRNLVLADDYDLYYGDIPRRPLFLRMIIDNVTASGLKKQSRVELFDEWITRKLLRDHEGPIDMGGKGRISLIDRQTSLDADLRAARIIMATAARAMIRPTDDGNLELTPFLMEDDLRSCLPAHLQQFNITGLVLGSLLMPVRFAAASRPLELRFAHRAFQEFLLAESLARTTDTATEAHVPDTVKQWIDEMRAAH